MWRVVSSDGTVCILVAFMRVRWGLWTRVGIARELVWNIVGGKMPIVADARYLDEYQFHPTITTHLGRR